MTNVTVFILGCFVLVSLNLSESAKISDDKSTISTAQLPGAGKTFGQQCREHNPTLFGGICANYRKNRCKRLICADTESGDIPIPSEIGPALDGTKCGKNKICLRGECVDDETEYSEDSDEFPYGCHDWLQEK